MFNKFKEIIKKGVNMINNNTELTTILNHPNVAMTREEKERIDKAWKFYKNEDYTEKYRTSLGLQRDRDSRKANIVKLVAKEYITSIFNDGCSVSVGEEKSEANIFLQDVLKNSTFNTSFANKLEYMFATGGLCVRPYYSSSTDRIEISWVLSNAFYPSETNTSKISSACIASVKSKTIGNKKYYYTLLEFHKWENSINPETENIEKAYIIENEMYKSDTLSKVGHYVPIGTDGINEGIESKMAFFGFKRPLFTYFKPNNTNNKTPSSELGMGICDDALGSVIAIQNTIAQLQREMAKGEPNIAVSQEMLKMMPTTDKTGQNRVYFDETTDVYSIFNGEEFKEPKDLTLDIRPEKYVEILNTHLRMLERETGLTSGTFEIDGTGALKTATEVMSENSQTYKTRNLQILTLNGEIKNLVLSIFQLARSYGLYNGEMPNEADITIDFSDGVFISQESKETAILKRYQSGTLSLWRTIMLLDNINEEDAKQRALEIKEENSVNDPFEQEANAVNNTLGAEE